MVFCSISNCGNSSKTCNLTNKGITFHMFPKDPDIKDKWISATGKRNWFPTNNSRICSVHFINEQFNSSTKRRTLVKSAVPTVDVWQFIMEDSPRNEIEIKVFCPKCEIEVSHTAEGIQEEHTKILIAKVYHYFEQEYEELKTIYGDLDLTPLSKFRQRTALATGVSETTVLQILKEEERRNADKQQEPSEKRRRARKRSRQTDSSSEEDSSDDNDDDNEQSSDVHDEQTVVVKIEPTEYYNEEPEIYVPATVKVEPSDVVPNKEQTQPDPISLDLKTEPRTDVVDNTDENLALNEPAGTKRRARKIPRSDVTPTQQHAQGCSGAATSSARLAQQQHQSSPFGDTEMKAEEIEIHEEGFS